MIRLLIADDHSIVRSGLRQIFALTSDIEVTAEAVNGAEVLDALRKTPCDLLLLDLNMPGITGTDLIVRIKSHWPQLPVLVLTMHNESQVATRVLKAGANGYLTKDCEPDVLLSAVRKVAAHGKYIAPELAEKMVFEATSMSPSAAHIQLSEREMEVFRLLVAGKGVNEIAAGLLISGKTVSTHKVRLMEKLKTRSTADLVRYAMAHKLFP